MKYITDVAWAVFYAALIGVPLGTITAGAYFGLDADVLAACIVAAVGLALIFVMPPKGGEE